MCRLAQPHDGQKRLVCTSDRVGVEIVSGVLRALKDLVKILNVNAVISSAESESEESERFIFLRLRLCLRRFVPLLIWRKPGLSCSKRG